MSNHPHIRSIASRQFPRLERLERRLPPGDALLGLLAVWPNSTPVIEAEYATVEKPDFEIEETVTDTVSDAEMSVIRSEVSVPRPEIRRADNNLALAPQDPIYGFAHTSNAITHVSIPLRIEQSVGAELGGLTPAVRGMTNQSLARRAGLLSRFEGELAAVAIPRDHDRSAVHSGYGALPLTFEENVGQSDARVDFLARGAGYTAFLTPTGAVFSLQNSEVRSQNSESNTGVALHMDIVGAKPQAAVGREELGGKVNYFIGNDPSQWHTNIATYGRVEYDDVYAGIDLVYYGKDQQLEYDFIVSPGADPSNITLNFAGADGAEIDDRGNLVLQTAAGDFVQQKPYLYQEVNSVRNEIAGNFVLSTEYSVRGTPYSATVSFDVGEYDPTRPLVIDPLVMGYSTYLGQSGSAIEEGHAIAVDENGSAYVVGRALLSNFPVTPGAFDTVPGGSNDAFVAKLNPTGTGLVYATYLGGSDADCVYGNKSGIKVDDAGHAYVTTDTSSTDFPTTPGAFDTTFNGPGVDVFVTKLSPNGDALIYSTYLGGSSSDTSSDLAIDSDGNAFVAGASSSANFPTTPGAWDTIHTGIYLTKLNATGSALLYSTFADMGDYFDKGFVAVDSAGNAYVTGIDAQLYNYVRVLKFSPTGTGLVYSFQFGPANEVGGIVVDTAGRAYVTGHTGSDDFFVTPGAFDTTYNGGEAFLTELNAAGNFILYSTFLGGSSYEYGNGIAMDANNNIYLTGLTNSADFPTTPDAFDASYNGNKDVYFAKLNTYEPAYMYATYLGGSNEDLGESIAVDNSNNVYVTGRAHSGFPTTPGAFKGRTRGNRDAFVTKLVET